MFLFPSVENKACSSALPSAVSDASLCRSNGLAFWRCRPSRDDGEVKASNNKTHKEMVGWTTRQSNLFKRKHVDKYSTYGQRDCGLGIIGVYAAHSLI